jgi:hypothetical protein
MTRLSHLLRLLRPVAAEDGSTLVLAMLVLSALSISTFALIGYARASENGFNRERQAVRSFDIAEAGVHYAFGDLVVRDPNDAVAVGTSIGSSAVPIVVTVDRGTASYWATKTAKSTWTVQSVGRSPDGRVTRQVSRQLQATNVATPAWNYGFYVAATSGCTNQVGTTDIKVPVWIGNDYCTSGSSGISEPGSGNTLDIYIGGRFVQGGASTIGKGTAPIRTAQIRGGCPNAGGGLCTAGNSRVFAHTYSSAASNVAKPEDGGAALYSAGNWRNPVCTTGTFTFENDATRNTSLGSVDLLNGPSFSCTVYDSTGLKTIGALAWDTFFRRLSIRGAVFIDGSLSTSSSAEYVGDGTIYFNGSASISGTLCGPPSTANGNSCTGSWDKSKGQLTIAALNGGLTMGGNGWADVNAYINGAYSSSGGAVVTGQVVTDTATLSGNSRAVQATTAPPAAPGVVTTWATLGGTWQQLQ